MPCRERIADGVADDGGLVRVRALRTAGEPPFAMCLLALLKGNVR
jgi:hypothetical protein